MSAKWKLTGSTLAIVLSLFGCGAGSTLTGVTNSLKQEWATRETVRLASLLELKGKASFTDKRNTFGCEGQPASCYDAAWYIGGGEVVYYNPWLEEQGEENVTLTAGHELCHDRYPNHDVKHWCCAVNILHIQASYPWPGPGGPACEGVK